MNYSLPGTEQEWSHNAYLSGGSGFYSLFCLIYQKHALNIFMLFIILLCEPMILKLFVILDKDTLLSASLFQRGPAILY